MSRRVLVTIVTLFTIYVYSHYHKCDAKINVRKSMEGKIVGGSYTTISKFPHAVFLLIEVSNSYMICGSSVVNQQILLTAGHCAYENRRIVRIDAYAGHENLKQVSVVRRVSKIAVHKDYDVDTLNNDIALLVLSVPLPLGGNIKRVILKPKRTGNPTAYVAGWGIINDSTKERSMILKMVKQVVRSRGFCSMLGKLHKGMMCAGDPSDIYNRPSKGDSGSGLIASDFQQLGLVSFRNENYKGLLVYTDVSYYYDWIKKISKNVYCSVKLSDSPYYD